MPVDRCVCHKVSFTELKRLIDAGTDQIGDLSDATGCCTGCGMCEPYVRLLIKTGQTSFPVIPPGVLDRLLSEAEQNDQNSSPSGSDGPGSGRSA